MASPTKAELWTQIANAIKILDQTYSWGNASLLSYIDTLAQSFEGDHVATTATASNSIRSSVNSVVSNGTSLLNALLLELGKKGYSSTKTSISDVLDDIYDAMHSSTETISSRDFTYGSVTAGGTNTGDGTVYRLTKDKNGYNLEGGGVPTGDIKIKINADKNNGRTPGNEQALIYGNDEVKTDELDLGSAPNDTLTISAARAYEGLLQNPTFDSYVSSPFSVSNWTLSGTFAVDTSIYYRLTSGSYSQGVALEFQADGSITQYINEQGITIDKTRPCFLIVRYRRKTCDGALTIRLGSKTASVADLTLVADATWIDLTIGTGTSTDGWYDNFKEDSSDKGVRVQVSLSGLTTGTLLIDEIILIQPSKYWGLYYLLTAGSTDFLVDDYFTFTDADAGAGVMQTWLARLYGKYMPHTTGVPTYADA